MRIWIDLWAPPDPLFFKPIVKRLHASGHSTWISAREFGETIAIAEQCGLDCTVIGRHGGEKLRAKAFAILKGAYQRVMTIRSMDIDLAVSFNSYSQGLAARLLGIPFVTCMDYEYQPANHLAFRLAQKVIVPRGFDHRKLRRQGGVSSKVAIFDGLKEHITMVDFRPDPGYPRVLQGLGVSSDDILITMRPPAVGAAYHQFENTLFDEAISFLAKRPGVKILVLPRSDRQATRIREIQMENLIIPSMVLDGPNLIYWSDLVVSGGGTMNREAVVLGTPAYTTFAGRMAGVDKDLIGNGELGIITSRSDLPRLNAVKQPKPAFRSIDQAEIDKLIREIVSAPGRIATTSS